MTIAEMTRNPKLMKKYAKKMSSVRSPKAIQKILRQPGAYKTRPEEYKDKIIDYPDSPTGRAYVGVNKSPFMPAASKGYGYQGVLIQDETREFIQCHGCGKWMKKLTDKHTLSCSKITVQQYKKKYGFNKERGLVSDETSLRLTKACLKNKIEVRLRNENFKKKMGNMGMGRDTKHSIEFMNQYGTCPLQLKTRLYEFILCNRELPSQGNRGRSIYKALVRRFGTYSHALTKHGLPFMIRKGTTMYYSFTDGTKYRYNLNQMYDREALYMMMMEKCPVLSAHAQK